MRTNFVHFLSHRLTKIYLTQLKAIQLLPYNQCSCRLCCERSDMRNFLYLTLIQYDQGPISSFLNMINIPAAPLYFFSSFTDYR